MISRMASKSRCDALTVSDLQSWHSAKAQSDLGSSICAATLAAFFFV
jgi:hypothetical protein